MRQTLRNGLGFVLLVGGLVSVGCGGHRQGDTFDNGKVRYRAPDPGPGWSEVVVDNADVAWFDDAHAAALLLNSHCEGVDDAPLQALTNHLVMGMTDRAVVRQETIMLSGREAMETEMTAKLDGVPRHMAMLVLKKDGCVYDLVLAAPPQHFDTVRAGYRNVKARFDVEARPGR